MCGRLRAESPGPFGTAAAGAFFLTLFLFLIPCRLPVLGRVFAPCSLEQGIPLLLSVLHRFSTSILMKKMLRSSSVALALRAAAGFGFKTSGLAAGVLCVGMVMWGVWWGW